MPACTPSACSESTRNRYSRRSARVRARTAKERDRQDPQTSPAGPGSEGRGLNFHPVDNPWFYVAALPALVLTGISKGGLGGGGCGGGGGLTVFSLSPRHAGPPRAAPPGERMVLGEHFGLPQFRRPRRRAAVFRLHAAAQAGQDGLRRHF